MADEKGRAERARARRRLFTGHGLVAVLLGLLDWPLKRSNDGVLQALFVAAVVVWLAVLIVQLVRRRRRAAAPDADGRWPAAERHDVSIDETCTGSRDPGVLVFGRDALRLTWTVLDSTREIEFADVASVRVRPAFIEVDTGDSKLRVVPSSYEARQRLLWEFAVHCNAAMERGIDEETGKERSREAALNPAPAAPAPDDPPPPPATRSATDAANLDGLDRGMTSLGSALAGPAHRGNPAPPRKSGLGVGLFPMPPAD